MFKSMFFMKNTYYLSICSFHVLEMTELFFFPFGITWINSWRFGNFSIKISLSILKNEWNTQWTNVLFFQGIHSFGMWRNSNKNALQNRIQLKRKEKTIFKRMIGKLCHWSNTATCIDWSYDNLFWPESFNSVSSASKQWQ